MLVVINADLHVNSTVGLCPPRVKRDAGGTYLHSREQAWLWECWQDLWQRVHAAPKDFVISVLLGDVPDLNQHSQTELICVNGARIIDACEEVVDGTGADQTFIARGTAAHSGTSGYLEELLAQRVKATPDENTASWWELNLDIEGVKFDLQHHGQTYARRPWTKDAAAGRQAAITWDEYMEDSMRPPDVVGRAHGHYWGQGFSRGTYGFFCPPWQLSTPFARRLGTGRIEPVGGVVFECRGGSWSRWKTTRYTPERRKWWSLSSS
jgi:hypothetical protein